jgi:hypothetical protein
VNQDILTIFDCQFLRVLSEGIVSILCYPSLIYPGALSQTIFQAQGRVTGPCVLMGGLLGKMEKNPRHKASPSPIYWLLLEILPILALPICKVIKQHH